MSNIRIAVVAPLEEWDDTTDVIVWLIEQKPELQISRYADLVLERYSGCHRFETLETQSAQLEGHIQGQGKVRLEFTAEYRIDIADPETGGMVEGYNVTVTSQVLSELKSKPKLFASYVVAGRNRKNFEIVNEVKAGEAQ